VLGCVAANLAALTHGSCLLLPGERFEARRCFDTLVAERGTSIYAVPTMFITLLEALATDRRRPDALRTGVVSGAGCPGSVMRQIVEELGIARITVGYGMTEMAPILYTSPDDAFENRATTAGTAQPYVECKVVDRRTGGVVWRGQVGELHARGPCRMSGYWNDAAATRRAIDERGWLHTGDLAVMRDDGYVSIVGRAKDLVIRGGENIAPWEIEQALQRHAGVREAYVVGVPDPHYGEELCALIRRRAAPLATAVELRRHCRLRLSANKIPRHIVFVDDLPTTATGKVQRFRLRALALEQLGLSDPVAVQPVAR
jgi:fatty-acyl-CoA synthase